MKAAALIYEQSQDRLLAQRVWRLAAVIGLHSGLIACAMHMQTRTTVERVPLRMEVRAIKTPSSPPSEVAKSMMAPPKPLPAVAQSMKRRSQPAAQAAVLAAAPSAEPAPPEFTAAPAAPAMEPTSTLAPLMPAPAAVEGPRFDADYLQNPAPAYPSLSRRMREEGKVLLQVRVSTAGLPEQIQIKHGSGYPRLDEAAINTVQRWRFVPARRGDETVSASVIVPILFRLEG
jgi:protein TonB